VLAPLGESWSAAISGRLWRGQSRARGRISNLAPFWPPARDLAPGGGVLAQPLKLASVAAARPGIDCMLAHCSQWWPRQRLGWAMALAACTRSSGWG